MSKVRQKTLKMFSSLIEDVPSTLTEDNWIDLDASSSAYARSKGIAERAAWKFIDELPGTPFWHVRRLGLPADFHSLIASLM